MNTVRIEENSVVKWKWINLYVEQAYLRPIAHTSDLAGLE